METPDWIQFFRTILKDTVYFDVGWMIFIGIWLSNIRWRWFYLKTNINNDLTWKFSIKNRFLRKWNETIKISEQTRANVKLNKSNRKAKDQKLWKKNTKNRSKIRFKFSHANLSHRIHGSNRECKNVDFILKNRVGFCCFTKNFGSFHHPTGWWSGFLSCDVECVLFFIFIAYLRSISQTSFSKKKQQQQSWSRYMYTKTSKHGAA